MRLHPSTDLTPKPLVTVGEKPILWHLMKYYAHFGHNDFILCLGYKGEQIKRYFLDYDECMTSDFVFSKGSKEKKLLEEDKDDWRITFVDTGLHSNIGQRLKAVQKHLSGEETFLANYSDGLTNLQLPTLIEYFKKKNKTACMLTVRPFHSYHTVSSDENGMVSRIMPLQESNIRINGGFFVLKNQVFDYIHDGEDLVNEPFGRLITKRELLAYNFNGFWANMDTYKDKQQLDDWASKGHAQWQVWITKQ
jgi:glucose-1-phosphate cytidylyltransferase